MEKIRVKVNGRGYFLKTDHPDELQKFAADLTEQIEYVEKKLGVTVEAEATALSALLLLGDSFREKRSASDQALIDDLTDKTNTLEERIDALTARINEQNAAAAAAQSEIQRLHEHENELIEQINALNERSRDEEEKYTDLNSSLGDTQKALESAKKLIEQLNSEKFTEVAANEALRTEIDTLREKLDNSNKQIAELNGKITKMEINSISVNPDGSVEANAEEIKRLKSQKEDLEIDLEIAREEIQKLKNGEGSENARKLAEYEQMTKQYRSRAAELDKLRNLLAETEASVRAKLEAKEEECDKLRNILSNYESSYALSIAKKEEEILELQQRVERLKTILNMRSEEKLGGRYIQTTFDGTEPAEAPDEDGDEPETKG
ncbi:MAG: hypothetical protein K5876_03915 [Ruminiclostridium sp.]|nr:hypothetical protein [Ruminiclostridium sp.]